MTEEQKKNREKVIQDITGLLQRNAFTFEIVVRKKPKGVKVVYEVTQEQLAMMASAAKRNKDNVNDNVNVN